MSITAKYYYGRTDENNEKYESQKQKQVGCPFCMIKDPTYIENEIIEETNYFWVITNAFPYEFFDSIKATDHLMIVPKKHTETISELTEQEHKSLIELINKYEPQGYTFMGRAPSNTAKTVAHQHTHLIKTI